MASSVAKFYRRKEIVTLLSRLSEERASIEAFTPHLDTLWDKTIYIAADILNQLVYRARLNSPGALFTRVEQLSYPPLGSVKRKNRFNDVGESIFYGSLGVLEPVMEIIPTVQKAPRLFTLSTIQRVNKTPLLAMPFGFSIEKYQGPLKAAHKVSIEYFNKEITKFVSDSDEEFYNSTIGIAKYVLKKEVENSPGYRNLALAYPSVRTGNIGANIAMLPSLFDAHFKFTSAVVCCLAPVLPDKNILHYLNKGEIDPAGSGSWLYDYEEMIKRIRTGLVLDMAYAPDDSVRPEVMIATDEP